MATDDTIDTGYFRQLGFDIGEVRVNPRTVYVVRLIRHIEDNRIFAEVRVHLDGKPTKWQFRVDPRIVDPLCDLLRQAKDRAATASLPAPGVRAGRGAAGGAGMSLAERATIKERR